MGVSDTHTNVSGWDSGNNMVNYIRSDSIDEQTMIGSLLSGDIFMVDPTRFRGDLEFFTSDGHPMGKVIIGSGGCCLFKMSGCQGGWLFNWAVNGKRFPSQEIGGRNFESEFRINGSKLVRCEAWDQDQR